MNHAKTNSQPLPQHRTPRVSRRYRWIVTVVIIALLCYVLAPQTDALWRSLEILRQAAWFPTLIAMAMTAMTYVLSAEIYHMLIKHPIRLRTMGLVQAATALTSRVVPIGIGTMGFNAYFLKRHSHTTAESLAVVAVNNGIGVFGHFLLLVLVATSAPLPPQHVPHLSWSLVYWVLLAIAVIAIVLALSSSVRRRILRGVRELWHAIFSYRHHRRKILGALAMSMLLSVVYVLALVAASLALHVYLPFNQLFLIYSFSLLTGAATPTPGGIVGVEAGLVGGMVAYGIPADTALAVALLYRLITYWLPLLPGFIAFRIVQHKYL